MELNVISEHWCFLHQLHSTYTAIISVSRLLSDYSTAKVELGKVQRKLPGLIILRIFLFWRYFQAIYT